MKSILAVALLAACACSRPAKSLNPDKLAAFAMEGVDSFHSQMAKQQFADICSIAGPHTFTGTTSLSCPSFLVYAHERLGAPLETMRTQGPGVEDRPAGDPVRVALHCATRFEHGLGLEVFEWHLEGTKRTLNSYSLESEALSR